MAHKIPRGEEACIQKTAKVNFSAKTYTNFVGLGRRLHAGAGEYIARSKDIIVALAGIIF